MRRRCVLGLLSAELQSSVETELWRAKERLARETWGERKQIVKTQSEASQSNTFELLTACLPKGQNLHKICPHLGLCPLGDGTEEGGRAGQEWRGEG